jgi:hypothetical protein
MNLVIGEEMNNTITLTDEQMKALQSGQSITIEPPKQPTTKWEPKEGRFRLTNELNVYTSVITNHIIREAGFQYQTESQAEQAAKALRSYARQLNWLHENDDGWIADWNNDTQSKYCVYLDYNTNTFNSTHVYYSLQLNNIYMSEVNAEKLCRLLNEGVVEF